VGDTGSLVTYLIVLSYPKLRPFGHRLGPPIIGCGTDRASVPGDRVKAGAEEAQSGRGNRGGCTWDLCVAVNLRDFAPPRGCGEGGLEDY